LAGGTPQRECGHEKGAAKENERTASLKWAAEEIPAGMLPKAEEELRHEHREADRCGESF